LLQNWQKPSAVEVYRNINFSCPLLRTQFGRSTAKQLWKSFAAAILPVLKSFKQRRLKLKTKESRSALPNWKHLYNHIRSQEILAITLRPLSGAAPGESVCVYAAVYQVDVAALRVALSICLFASAICVRTRRNRYDTARALASARRRNDVSRCNGIDMPPYGPLCASTTSSTKPTDISQRGGPSHGLMWHTQNIW